MTTFKQLVEETIQGFDHTKESIKEALGASEEREEELVELLDKKVKEKGRPNSVSSEIELVLQVCDTMAEVIHLTRLVTIMRMKYEEKTR